MPYILLDPLVAAAAPATTAGQPLTSVGETLSTLQTTLQEEMGNRGDVDAVKAAKWINTAYKYLCSVLNIKDLFPEVALSLTSGQSLYLIPSSVAWVKSIALVDAVNNPVNGGEPLTSIDDNTFRKLPEDTINFPSMYLRDQRLVAIYPEPRASYTAIMKFKVRPSDLVSSTDSPILPPEFHEALVLRAKHVGFRTLKNHVESGIARNDFATDIRSIEDADAMERNEMPMGVRPIRKASDFKRLR